MAGVGTQGMELTRQEVETAVCGLEDELVRGSMRCHGTEAIGRALLTANGAYKVMGRQRTALSEILATRQQRGRHQS